jgi:transcription elongation factor GreA
MALSATQPRFPEEERLGAPRAVPRVILTREGERTMRTELERLRLHLVGEFTERLREARGFGSSHENDEYLQIKEEEAVVASRIRQLESLLELASVVDEDSVGPGVVAIGSRVEVRDTGSGAVREHLITGSFEPVEPGDVSANSPVGQALLGRSPGETVEVELPNGRATALEVLAVGSDSPMAQPDRA